MHYTNGFQKADNDGRFPAQETVVADRDRRDSGRGHAVLLHRLLDDRGSVPRRGRGLGDLSRKARRQAVVACLRPLRHTIKSERAAMRFVRQRELDGQGLENFGNGNRASLVAWIMNYLWQDLRYGIRMLLNKPGFTAAAVLVLALGIGANSAVFSLVNAFLFKPLLVQKPEELRGLYSRDAKHPDTYR